jgi:integrase
MSDAITQFLASKANSNFRPAYVNSLRQYLLQFARGREHVPVASIRPEDIEAWFISRSESPTTRASNLGRLSSFFQWCKRRRYIRENPCDFIERARIDRPTPRILTVAQVEKCLKYCCEERPRFLLWFVLACIVGIRRDELSRMTRDDVKRRLDSEVIIVDSAASKVRLRRIVELNPWQLQWVKFAESNRLAELPLPKTYVVRSLRHLRTLLGMDEWPQDILRHTALSHMLVQTKDAGKVALWAGNSPKILMTHYNGLVMPAENARLRSIIPA